MSTFLCSKKEFTPCPAVLWLMSLHSSFVKSLPVKCLWLAAEQCGLQPCMRLPSLVLCVWFPEARRSTWNFIGMAKRDCVWGKDVYLNILDEGSNVEERNLDRLSHLLIGCIHEHLQSLDAILVVLPQPVYLVGSCILQKTKNVYIFNNKIWKSPIAEIFLSHSKEIKNKPNKLKKTQIYLHAWL